MKSQSKLSPEFQSTLLVFGFVLLAVSTAVFLLPSDVFWITDEGTKFIQLQSYVRTGSIPIEYPSRELDPELRFLPDAGHHLLRYGTTIYSLYLPYFSILTAIPYRMVGTYGILLLPVLTAIGTLVLVLLFQRRIFSRVYPADLLLLFFGTPLFFYSVTYWEHVPAIFFSTAACYFLVTESERISWRIPFAGLLLAISTLIREEGYIVTIAAILAIAIVHRSFRRFIVLMLSYVSSMALPFLWHQLLYGHILGPHGAFYSGYSSLKIIAKISGAYEHLFRFHNNNPLNLIIALPFLAAVSMGVRRESRFKTAILIGCSLSSVMAICVLVTSSDRIFATSAAKGFFVAVPWLALILINYRHVLANDSREIQFLGTASLFFLLGALATLESSGTWIIWGPRFFLAVLPLQLILFRFSMKAIEGNRVSKVAVAVMIICSFMIQANGIYDLALKKKGTKKIQEAVLNSGSEVVLTDVFWIPQELASLFYQKRFLFVRSDNDLRIALTRFQQHGIRNFTFVVARDYRKLSGEALRSVLKRCTSRTHVLTRGMQFMEVIVLKCETREEQLENTQ